MFVNRFIDTKCWLRAKWRSRSSKSPNISHPPNADCGSQKVGVRWGGDLRDHFLGGFHTVL